MAVTFKVEKFFDKEEVREILNEVRRPVEIAIWGCRNYYNFGGAIRTGHNFLVSKFWGIDLQRDPENPISKPYYRKSAMTTEKWEKKNLEFVTSEEFLEQTKDRKIVGFERRENLQTQDIRAFKYPENPILLFGSESGGIPDHLMDRVDALVSIPCDGFCLDMNVGVALGIALYDWYYKFSMKV